MDERQYKQIFSSLQMMEQYLKRIANEPLASPTTPLGSSSPGRSSRPTPKGIYPDSNRMIKEQAAPPTGSQRATRPTAIRGPRDSIQSVSKTAVDIILDGSKISPIKMYLAQRAMGPFAESLKQFINTISEIDSTKADSIRNITGIGQILRGLGDIEHINPVKTSFTLKWIAQGVATFIEKITDIKMHDSDRGALRFVGSIMSGLQGILKIKVSEVIAAKVFMPVLGTIIKQFADKVASIDVEKSKAALSIIPKMGLSLVGFTVALIGTAIAITAVTLDPLKFLLLFTIMGATALAFNTIGKYGADINKGSLAVAGMGLGTLAFVGGLALSAAIMPPLEKLLTVPLAIAAMGGVFYLAGTLWDKIALGALAMGAVGLATWIISKPIETIATVLNQNPSVIWQLPLMLVGLGSAFALAGAGPVPLFIGAGALALGAAGGALWALGKGLTTMLSLPTITPEKADGIALGIRSVVTGFGKSFEDLSLKDAVTLPLKIPMVGLMGLTLFGLAAGIANYQAKAGSFGPKDSENLKNTISGLSSAFATAGSSEGMSKLFGFNVGSNDVERGIDSTLRMGKNLSALAEGVLVWKKMPLTPADVQTISDNVGRILNVIPGIFAGVGKVDAGTTGKMTFLGLTFENPFSKGDTERGISSTLEMGQNLKNLSEGVLAWKDGGKAGFKAADLPGIVTNITSILGTIPGAFAELGKTDRDTSGVFPWSEGDIENGLELAEGLSPSLQAISDLLNSVKTGNIAKATSDISTNIPVLLKSYAIALNDFGATLKEDPEDTLEQISDIIETFVEVSESTSQINTQIGKLADLADPLEKVAKAMTSVNVAFKAQIAIMSKINEPKFEAYAKYYSAVSEVAKADAAQLRQNLDAVIKSGFGNQEMNEAMAAQRVAITNQNIQAPPNIKVNVPKVDMASQDKLNTQILESLRLIAGLLAQANSSGAQQAKALEELIHTVNAGLKIKDNSLG